MRKAAAGGIVATVQDTQSIGNGSVRLLPGDPVNIASATIVAGLPVSIPVAVAGPNVALTFRSHGHQVSVLYDKDQQCFLRSNPYHDNMGRFTSPGGGPGVLLPSGSPNTVDGPTSAARYRQVIGNRAAAAVAAAKVPDGELYVGYKPMTDEQFTEQHHHVEHELAKRGADNLMHSPESTHISEDYIKGVEGSYNDHRRSQQNQIMNEYRERAADVPAERKAIIMGGLGGAGKSTMIRMKASQPDSVAGKLGIKFASYDDKGDGVGDPVNFLILNPDDIKERMAAMDMVPRIDHLSPMEASPFVHEEASSVIKDIGAEAERQGKNIIWDITF